MGKPSEEKQINLTQGENKVQVQAEDDPLIEEDENENRKQFIDKIVVDLPYSLDKTNNETELEGEEGKNQAEFLHIATHVYNVLMLEPGNELCRMFDQPIHDGGVHLQLNSYPTFHHKNHSSNLGVDFLHSILHCAIGG